MDLVEKLKINTFPNAPGIYLFFDKNKKLIYVGKATSLKARVKSYFIGKRTPRPIEQMLHEVITVKYIQTDSVLEAIILESNCIKKHTPKYNIIGKDDKSWNYITISRDEYPIVDTLRQHDYKKLQIENNKALKEFTYVFGPYPGLNAKATMKILRRLFQFSTCQKTKRASAQKFTRPCLYYQMGECLGVCTGEILPADYKQKVIRPLVTFLKGNKKQLIKSLERDMKKASRAEDYEEAARLRDQLNSLMRIQDIALLNQSFFNDDIGQVDNELTQNLGFAKDHIRIEGYDISNLGTSGKVGSMVVFNAQEPIKSEYRKFKIKTVVGQSDVDCLREVLTRRLKHAEWKLPQVFLIDGGRPQVHAALGVIQAKSLNIPVVGIAKGSERKKNEFILGSKAPEFVRWVETHRDLLIKVRDEAHRFAVSYQKKLRRVA